MLQSSASIQGQIWIDAEDWSIVRIQGSLAKRPSFWTRQTQIDRRYKRIDGIWLNDSLESTSDILIAGRDRNQFSYPDASMWSLPTDTLGVLWRYHGPFALTPGSRRVYKLSALFPL